MKKEFLPFYISRAVLSFVSSAIMMGFTWKALLLAIFLFGFMLLYLHSGWFSVDLSHPFFPLRRDARGLEIQRKALIASVILATCIYLLSSPLARLFGLTFSGDMAIPVAVVAYFATQFVLFART